ncbi:MAG: type II secretion system F family protein [Parasporobacterium sp.]|nr:type II secretion system F family protein [Parasporobacterium sp.]
MKKTLSNETLSVFFHDVSMMIASGTPMDGILSVLSEDCADETFVPVLKAMLDEIFHAAALSKAMENSGVFPDYAIRMIKAGEAAGKLEDVTEALSLYYEQRRKTAELVSSALKRPLILLVIVAIVTAVFLWGILPAISALYTTMGGDSSIYLTAAYIIGGVVFGAIALGLIFSIIMWICSRSTAGQGFINRLYNKSFVTRDISSLFYKAQYISDIDVRISGGTLPDDAFEQAEKTVANTGISAQAARITARVHKGESLANIFIEEKFLPPVCTHIMFTSLQNGEPEEAFHKVRGILFSEAEKAAESLISKIEPLITGVFMIAVGLALLSIIMPLIGVITFMG